MALKRHRFVGRRRMVGLSQERLAELMRVDRTTVARWEAGRTAPQPWMRPRLARALAVTAEQLDELLQDVSPTEMPRLPEAVERAPLRPSAAGLTTAAALRERFDGLCARYDTMPSAALLTEAAQQLGDVTRVAGEARQGRAQRELRTLQADTARLVGQIVWDASQRRDQETARSYYEQSLSLARHLGDRSLESHALLRTGFLALYGANAPRAALPLFEQAAAAAEPVSQALAGLALLHVAEAQATIGDAGACERALAAAERRWDRARSTDAAIDLVSTAQFSRLAGSCYLTLGQLPRARRLLETSAHSLSGKSRALVLGNLALTHMRQRRIEAATHTLNEAITEAEETRGGAALTVIFTAGRELRPWWTHPPVADVHDRLLGLLASPRS